MSWSEYSMSGGSGRSQKGVYFDVSGDMLLRKGRLANIVVRDRSIREAVLEQGYLASQVAKFLGGHPSNVCRALQKS
jgi:hypothetical protein